MASSGVDGKEKYRSFLYGEGEEKTKWRFGEPPSYDVVNKLFEEGKTKVWPPGSLEEMVQNLVKTWEMEILHKARVEDFKAIDPSFTYSVNGRKALNLKELGKLDGGYNAHLIGNLTARASSDLQPGRGKLGVIPSSFYNNFPSWFCCGVLQVYCGPPEIVFKFRHWGFMEDPFKGHAPTGESIELFGIGVLEVIENKKILKVKVFYDRGELLGNLVKGEKIETRDGEATSSCPIFKNTG